jgi:hypothetical protein
MALAPRAAVDAVAGGVHAGGGGAERAGGCGSGAGSGELARVRSNRLESVSSGRARLRPIRPNNA